ncbi:MAG TPA: alanine dehydrogenase, partial [Gammaproteobacteria bacterium]|nr:alanine dehydrogenase [Gammaproteobacteria bacterium]
MLIGVPKEIKNNEYRVGLVPGSVRELIANGHQVMVQSGAGVGIGFDDHAFEQAGAKIVKTAVEIFQAAEMIIKVKEPQPEECRMLREGQVLFTYLHLAPDPEQAKLLQKSGCIAIAYETVTNSRGGLPLLAPMSEVAGRMAIQAGATCLEITNKGSGVLLGGVPGVAPAKVVVLGGGVVGTNSVRVAMGMGANVTVIDKSLERLYHLDLQFGSKITTIYSTTDAIEEYV